ncbi:GNAT family N-acetyltransferase [Cognatiyoonia sp. IB215182]|uniref:GNAT family N-acetyltransferase n=1 Tax=Cognatiyoonia sp. IB215182 TaxID=3097353 RepID=UPI002A0C58EC|nr:GNAT family N-acetyltransferase [Cognatiyoonia sp. IB215182]MDX8354856.1 GNAT family N-acetyltransferase [Cognatiyoonia sp. IB215182]
MNMQPHLYPVIRRATRADIPFLAKMDIEASSQPFGVPFWVSLLESTQTTPEAFVEAMLRENASHWGKVEDFLIVEVQGSPAATCCVFRPDPETASAGPLDLENLPAVGWSLGWSQDQIKRVEAAYLKAFGAEAEFLKPQADLIIETVAVALEHRGEGLGHLLMKAAFDRGREMGAKTIGIMVIHGNDSAQALYEKHFEPFATFYGAYFDHEFPGVTKYRASLTTEKE